MDLYAEVITITIENGDMNLLPSLWNLTLVFKACGDGAIFRTRITKKIPDIAAFYQIPTANSFPEFAQLWDAEILGNKIGPLKAVFNCIVNNNLAGVKYLTNKHPKIEFNWPDLCIQAINHNNFELMKVFFNKIEERKRIHLINSGLFYAAKRNNLEIVHFFLTEVNFAQEKIDYVFDAAICEESEEVADYAIKLGVSDKFVNLFYR